MSQPQRLIFEDGDNSYEVFIDTAQPVRSNGLSSATAIAAVEDEYISKSPTLRGAESIIPPAVIVELEKVHHTIRGYAQYAIGAFKNLAIAEVEEVKLKFSLKISAACGLPMIASSKTDADFSIEVKCKFPKDEKPQ
ncbi:CU044_2847 family protein [Chamaesiphon sp. OTE_75_metabat_556]|uniref:CU044_2847 family protein n=1 Tax=Chamaesiphon sp. OTE_75_metabat_556 TaxID=2964692 RepID=UPI00286C0B77|nr:CU044_2847 family protein [Chamaesiphon sp. OTE_75_metabat_556]